MTLFGHICRYGLTQTGIYACFALANLVGPAVFANMFAVSTAMDLWYDGRFSSSFSSTQI